jgi:serine phosphatase RsbU (regulator of sigma subunit)
MMEGVRHTARCTTLRAGDWLLAYTDGLPEAMNARHEPLGEAQVAAALMAASAGPAELLAQLSRQLDQHVGDCPPHDDVTVLCLAAMPV